MFRKLSKHVPREPSHDPDRDRFQGPTKDLYDQNHSLAKDIGKMLDINGSKLWHHPLTETIHQVCTNGPNQIEEVWIHK